MEVGSGALCTFFSFASWGAGCYKSPLSLSPLSPHSAPALGFPVAQALSCLWAFESLVISVGQEFGSSLAGWLGLRVSREVAVEGHSHPRVCLVMWDLLPKWLTHTAGSGCCLLAGGLRLSPRGSLHKAA